MVHCLSTHSGLNLPSGYQMGYSFLLDCRNGTLWLNRPAPLKYLVSDSYLVGSMWAANALLITPRSFGRRTGRRVTGHPQRLLPWFLCRHYRKNPVWAEFVTTHVSITIDRSGRRESRIRSGTTVPNTFFVVYQYHQTTSCLATWSADSCCTSTWTSGSCPLPQHLLAHPQCPGHASPWRSRNMRRPYRCWDPNPH